jgi:hypothetical protein
MSHALHVDDGVVADLFRALTEAQRRQSFLLVV